MTPTTEQVLRIVRAGAWAGRCRLCGRVLRCVNSRRVAGIRVRDHRCPDHRDVAVGTIEVVISRNALKILLCEAERERRVAKRLRTSGMVA